MEILNRELSLVNLSLHGGHHTVHLLHQMANRIAHLLETFFTPPLGLISI